MVYLPLPKSATFGVLLGRYPCVGGFTFGVVGPKATTWMQRKVPRVRNEPSKRPVSSIVTLPSHFKSRLDMANNCAGTPTAECTLRIPLSMFESHEICAGLKQA